MIDGSIILTVGCVVGYLVFKKIDPQGMPFPTALVYMFGFALLIKIILLGIEYYVQW